LIREPTQLFEINHYAYSTQLTLILPRDAYRSIKPKLRVEVALRLLRPILVIDVRIQKD
jgi:hypothetical protein